MIDYPNELNIIFDKLNYFSIKPIIVGGYIRDYLLKKSSKDIDIELYGISSYEKLQNILQEFGNVNTVGKSFGVCKLQYSDLSVDFSLPRMDSKIDEGHKGFSVTTDTSLDYETATRRRDFTINAIGYDVLEKKLLDPFFGIKDLRDKMLRAVDISKFDEDPLRVLRAVQFSARFAFTLEPTLFEKCKTMIEGGVLEELPSERIFEEIKKFLLKSKKPSLGLELLKRLHGFLYFSELNELNKEDYMYARNTLDWFANNTQLAEKNALKYFVALLCYSLSKESRIAFIQKLSSEKKLLEDVNNLIDCAKDFDFEHLDNFHIYLLATKINIEEFCYFLRAVHLGNLDEKIKYLQESALKLKVFTSPLKPLVHGKDLVKLKLKPSKEFSTILDKTYAAQMREVFETKDEALVWVKKEFNFS